MADNYLFTTPTPELEILRNELDELKVRFYARLTSYLCTINNLEKNLEFTFKNCCKNILSDANIDQEIKDRKNEINSYLFWRHKVFAHLADTQHHKNDTATLKDSVVSQYGGYITNLRHDECLAIGYGSDDFPEISIVCDHNKLIAHYDNWQTSFINAERLRSSQI